MLACEAKNRLASTGTILVAAFLVRAGILSYLSSHSASAGVLRALRTQKEAALPLVMMVMAYPLVFYVTHASLRYRQPMDGIMLVLAVYAAGGLLAPLAARFRATDRAAPIASGMSVDSQREI